MEPVAGTPTATDMLTLVIIASEDSFDAPTRVEAGPAATPVNNGKQQHDATAMPTNDGVLVGQFTAVGAHGAGPAHWQENEKTARHPEP